MRTIRHFFPEINAWMDEIRDPRFLPSIVYHKRFLVWWGLSLFLFKLGSRRQLDYELDAQNTRVLDNLNRLAGTQQKTRPVNKTLNYFLGRIGAQQVADLRTRLVRRLLRMRVLDAGRLQGHWVTATDGTGYLLFRQRHCPYCLERRYGEVTLYLHQVLEAKLLGPEGLVVSLGTVFIDQSDTADTPADADAERRKQDCELKAFNRLDAQLRTTFPQLSICYSGDSLFGCGRGLAMGNGPRRAFVYVLKPGRLPTLWQEFQTLLPLCAGQRRELVTSKGVRQVYRWVDNLSYTDSDKRPWSVTAIQCEETVDGQTTTWAWITNLKVNAETVISVATKGGRHRWHIENQGFNTQKNSGLNLEHAYSHRCWQAFYYLLQIAHLILQLVEKGNLLRQLAQELDKTPAQLFGSLKNIARRLLESFRFVRIQDEAYDPVAAAQIQIRLDSG
ncbi:MAG: hypothetical protein HY040_27315 [Planctomycetes bacterium]|nr:hypothetical protein [Planctomycetota bacterium]